MDLNANTTDTARWTLVVSRETDSALQDFLAAKGMRQADLASFVEDAVRWRLFDRTVQGIKARHADSDTASLQDAIDEACAAVRGEMWPSPPRPA